MSDFITRTVEETLALSGLSEGVRSFLSSHPPTYFVTLVEQKDGTTRVAVVEDNEHNKKVLKKANDL